MVWKCLKAKDIAGERHSQGVCFNENTAITVSLLIHACNSATNCWGGVRVSARACLLPASPRLGNSVLQICGCDWLPLNKGLIKHCLYLEQSHHVIQL